MRDGRGGVGVESVRVCDRSVGDGAAWGDVRCARGGRPAGEDEVMRATVWAPEGGCTGVPERERTTIRSR